VNGWHSQRERSPNLLPEELCQTKSATAITTKAKQANEHYKKQDDVSDSHRDEGGYIGWVDVVDADEQQWHPFRVQLQMRSSWRVQIIEIYDSPERHLLRNHGRIHYMACSRGEKKEPTFNKKYSVDPPHTDGHHDGYLISVPNCNTRSIDEHCFEKTTIA
jgi:hypothetical protein